MSTLLRPIVPLVRKTVPFLSAGAAPKENSKPLSTIKAETDRAASNQLTRAPSLFKPLVRRASFRFVFPSHACFIESIDAPRRDVCANFVDVALRQAPRPTEYRDRALHLPRIMIPAGVRVRAEPYLVRSSYITSCEGGFASVPPRAGLMGPASPAGPTGAGSVVPGSPLVMVHASPFSQPSGLPFAIRRPPSEFPVFPIIS